MKNEKIFLWQPNKILINDIDKTSKKAILFNYNLTYPRGIDKLPKLTFMEGLYTFGYIIEVEYKQLKEWDIKFGNDYRRYHEIVTDFNNITHTVWIYEEKR